MADERIPSAHARKFDVTLTLDRRDPVEEEIISYIKRAKFGKKTSRIKKLVVLGYQAMQDERNRDND